MKLTPFGKVILFIIVLGLAYGGWRLWQKYDLSDKLMPSAPTKVSAVPPTATLPPVPGESAATPTTNLDIKIPGGDPGLPDKPQVRMLVMAWNAQMGLMFANGGPVSTNGSLMCKYGVNLKITRQDDCGKMQEQLIALATALSNGSDPGDNPQFVVIMGDGSATFLKSINDKLKRLGPEYLAKVVGVCGYSRGEDKFMGPQAWKDDPAACKGGVVAGVIRDGDWNIAQKWLGDNGLRNNPDEKTWDPDALNWINASDYLDAPTKYITGYTEERDVVRDGKRTGEKKTIGVDAVVTWTPGDVNVAQKKGGLVGIVSTREYSTQMPAVIIGIDKWMKDNRSTVEGMLHAIAEGGDAVRASEDALRHASVVSQEIYQEHDVTSDYWEKYYKGAVEKDSTGLSVSLGGSKVCNLTDSMLCFGLMPGSANLFGATYTVFGDIVKTQYPELVPSYYPVDQILDTSYLKDVAKQANLTSTQLAEAKPQYEAGQKIKNVVSRKAWHIQFASGKADLTPGAKQTLDQMRRDLLVASGTIIEIHGHTDNQGSVDSNQILSEARAFAVKKWLQAQNPLNFPDNRIQVFAHGQTNPVAPNTTEAGRAQNRRVEIILGTSSGERAISEQ